MNKYAPDGALSKDRNMIIIGFTHKTSKVLPRIFCRNFRHVAVFYPTGACLTMYQFVHRNRIAKIKLRWRDIKILTQHGWVFVCLPGVMGQNLDKYRVWTCVQLAKHAVGMHAFCVQTPDALYKKIKSP